MNKSRHTFLARVLLPVGMLLAAAGAQAGDKVYWAVNVDAPVQGMGRLATAVSNTRGGVYAQPGVVVYGQPQVVYAPPPAVVYQPAPVMLRPQPVYVPQRVRYVPVPVGVRPVGYMRDWDGDGRRDWDDGRRYGRRHHHHHHHRDDDRYAWDDR